MSFSEQQQDALAKKILLYSRRYITRSAPVLLQPIYALQEKRSDVPGPMSTNGVFLWYDPAWVIDRFREDRCAPARELLHVTLHCLLGHLRQRENALHKPVFDAAADHKIASFIRQIDTSLVPGEIPEFDGDALPLRRALAKLEADPGTARSIIQKNIKNGLRIDDHDRWGIPPAEKRQPGGTGQTVVIAIAAGGDANAPGNGSGAGGEGSISMPDWAQMLAEAAGQAEKGSWGSIAGMLRAEIEAAQENSVSYAKYLERFASQRERMLLDPDSFDVRWYYIGLEQYGNIPLLEPSELCEPPVPDDIVLALDTSGSCSGAVCSRFLRESMNLLRDISMGAASFRVLALQCDTEIQAELLLESPDQIDTFLADFAPKGFGGTDFRPVFQQVARRRSEGTMPRVKGLIYLSDGFGDFPEEAPDYPVTFLLLEDDDGCCSPDLPGWVNALWLNTKDFTLREVSRS